MALVDAAIPNLRMQQVTIADNDVSIRLRQTSFAKKAVAAVFVAPRFRKNVIDLPTPRPRGRGLLN